LDRTSEQHELSSGEDPAGIAFAHFENMLGLLQDTFRMSYCFVGSFSRENNAVSMLFVVHFFMLLVIMLVCVSITLLGLLGFGIAFN
jgi:hypothetical protein